MKKMILSAAVLILAWGLPGCGGGDDDGGPHPPKAIPLKEGTWQVVRTPSQRAGGEACLLGSAEGGDTHFEFISSQCESSDFTDDSFPCDFDFSNGKLSVQCDFNTSYSGCESRMVVDGEGTYTETTYEITYEVELTSNGACGDLVTCTGTIQVQGTWVSSEGDCDDEDLEEFSLSPVHF